MGIWSGWAVYLAVSSVGQIPRAAPQRHSSMWIGSAAAVLGFPGAPPSLNTAIFMVKCSIWKTWSEAFSKTADCSVHLWLPQKGSGDIEGKCTNCSLYCVSLLLVTLVGGEFYQSIDNEAAYFSGNLKSRNISNKSKIISCSLSDMHIPILIKSTSSTTPLSVCQ